MTDEFDDDKHIDPDELDVECLRQADLAWKYGQQLTHAKAQESRCKDELEQLGINLLLDARRNPEVIGLGPKPNAEMFEAYVKSHEDYRAAFQLHLNASKLLSDAFDRVKAIDAKKSALEGLIKLHGQQYFSSPANPGLLSQRASKRCTKTPDKQVPRDRLKRRADKGEE